MDTGPLITTNNVLAGCNLHLINPLHILIQYGHRIEQEEDEVILTVPECPPQVARIKRGLREYDCKEMHMSEFVQIAKEVDPRIRIKCEFAPPDPHPDKLFCKWRFYLS